MSRKPLVFFISLISLSVLAILLGASAASAQSAAPAIFYSDLPSGPTTGGENNNGAIVTIYGKGFGSSQGSSSVTVGGGPVAGYKLWSDAKVAFALGSGAKSGNIVISVGGQTSNGTPFTIRGGTISCVSTSGSDSNSGAFPSSCWRTILQAKTAASNGSIAYIETGVSQTGQDNYASTVVLQTSCTAAAPCSLIAYPGATVTVGGVSDQNRGIYFYGGSNWVIAGLTIRAIEEGIQNNGESNVRIVGNDISCPNGSGQDACIHAEGGASGIVFYGNYVHETGTNCGSDCKEYHAYYMSTNTNHVDVGWNTIVPNPNHTATAGCRAIQFYSTGGSDQYDLHVHDNVIHDAICDGINFATVNPDNGTVEAYNNVVYHVGTGPDPNGAESNYTCVNAGSSGSPSASVNLYNNTFYDCGSRGASEGDAGTISCFIHCNMQNDISYQLSGESFMSNSMANQSASSLKGSNNIWYGISGAPSQTTGNITVNPSFVSTSTPDFHLQSSSPAIGAGVNTGVVADIDGLLRGSVIDIGAYQFSTSASVAQKPNPPTNLTVTVQ